MGTMNLPAGSRKSTLPVFSSRPNWSNLMKITWELRSVLENMPKLFALLQTTSPKSPLTSTASNYMGNNPFQSYSYLYSGTSNFSIGPQTSPKLNSFTENHLFCWFDNYRQSRGAQADLQKVEEKQHCPRFDCSGRSFITTKRNSTGNA